MTCPFSDELNGEGDSMVIHCEMEEIQRPDLNFISESFSFRDPSKQPETINT